MKRIFVLTSLGISNELRDILAKTGIPAVAVKPETEEALYKKIEKEFQQPFEEIPEKNYMVICTDRQFLDVAQCCNCSVYYMPSKQECRDFALLRRNIEAQSIQIFNYLSDLNWIGEFVLPTASFPIRAQFETTKASVYVTKFNGLDVTYRVSFKDPILVRYARIAGVPQPDGHDFIFKSGVTYDFKEV